MRLTVLGSGDHAGIPRLSCDCAACERGREGGLTRGNTAALIEADSLMLGIDTGCGRAPGTTHLLLTHVHPDHAGRIQDFTGLPVLYGAGCLVEGEGLPPCPPQPHWLSVPAFTTVSLGAVRVTPLPLDHTIPAVGWVVEQDGQRIAWCTDTYGLPAESVRWLRAHPCDLLAIDTTFAPGTARAVEKRHGTIDGSLEAIAASAARRGLLIHIGHELQCWLDDHPDALPDHVEVAHDRCVYLP